MPAAQQTFVDPFGPSWSMKLHGKLVILGENSRIRQKDTIGRPNPRNPRR